MAIGFDADVDTSHVARAAAAKGVAWVGRYLHPHVNSLTTAECNALSAAGLKILSIWEHSAGRARQGAIFGAADGAAARDAAAALGQPQGHAIVATDDEDTQEADQPAVLDYLASFKAALGGQAKMMVYANGAICEAALDAGIADYTWLAGGHGMRGSAEFYASKKWTIAQDVGDKHGLSLGIGIDSNESNGDDLSWAWSVASLAPAVPVPEAEPEPAPAPTPAEPDPAPPAPEPVEVDPVSQAIMNLQRALNAAGASLEVDGELGPDTEKALREHFSKKS